jgi:arabinofuranosyltransferase
MRRRKNTPPARSVDSGNLWLAGAIGLLAVLAVYAAHAWYFRHYINDDAFITFRYSRFVGLGRGPYFNVGEHVEGYSNPLLMLALVPVVAWGGVDAVLPAAKFIGVAAGALSLIAAYGLTVHLLRTVAPRMAPPIGGCVAAGLVAVSPAFAINSMSGLETTLFAFTITVGVLLGTVAAHDGRWRGAGVAFATAILARPEGPLIFAVYWCAQLIGALLRRSFHSIRSHLFLDGAIVTGVFAAHLVFRYVAYDGEWVPNTYFAKSGGFWAVDAGAYIRAGILSPLGGAVAVAAGLIGCAAGRGAIARMLPVAAVAVAGSMLPFVTGTDWMPGERLLVPYLPLAAVVVAAGWLRISSAIVARPVWLAPAVVLAAVPTLWLAQSSHRRALFEESSLRARGYRDGHAALAEWLCSGVARQGDSIALMDIGIIGYRCIDQTIVDITGLTDRVIAKSPGRFLDKQYDPGYIFERKPRFIVMVIKQPGDPAGLPTNAGFATWTNIERGLLRHPEFNRWYRTRERGMGSGERGMGSGERGTGSGEGSGSWQAGLARNFGAVRLFQHAHPGMFYLLTVFERQDQPAR